MVASADKISYIKTLSELEALLLEAKLINLYQPKYNIIAKDDKHPLYIRITKENFPRILTARKIEVQSANLAFYGPFPSTKIVHQVLLMLRKIFPYADHKPGKKACFYCHLGLCNPCPNIITTPAQISTYRKNIFQIKNILSGKIDFVSRDLRKQIDNYARKQLFEQAAALLPKLRALEYIQQPISDISGFLENPNLAEDLRAGEAESLRQLLGIKNEIYRIECFDVAHLSGLNATAAQVTFLAGEPEKAMYRSYRIRQKKSRSDTDSLSEVAKRRFNHLADWGRPDLIIIDGGKAQTQTFWTIFAPVRIPVVGLAKKRETLVFPDQRELVLPPGPVRNLLQRVRNEAHRFAQKYHHQLMTKALM